jgi:protein involved in ribonucleotide reduction
LRLTRFKRATADNPTDMQQSASIFNRNYILFRCTYARGAGRTSLFIWFDTVRRLIAGTAAASTCTTAMGPAARNWTRRRDYTGRYLDPKAVDPAMGG